MSADQAELEARLREVDSERLLELVTDHGEELSPATVRRILAHPFVTAQVIQQLVKLRHLLPFYEVRRGIALHPRAPQAVAMRFVPGLYWRDLVQLGADTKVRPAVRRAADRALAGRLPGLALGERIAVARSAGLGLLSHVRHDVHPRVVGAVLENPRLTEGLLSPVVSSESTPPPVLAVIAENRRWGSRYPIRVGLSRNPRTPVQQALGLLPLLKKQDLRAVARDPRLAGAVRRRARTLLGEA